MDSITKVFLIVFVTALSYLVLNALIQPFFVKEPRTMLEAMQRVMGFSQQSTIPNVLSLVIALGIGLIASFRLRTKTIPRPDSKQRALSIVKKKLSDDEKKMLKEIEKAGAITQDSLRARLGWSKAKISTTLTRLDKMNLIQRERQGKTYRVFLSKDLR
ncbi:MAG: hypothetical protein QMD97_04790 [Candidatus Aenigmarchaeota archaeon]|nr:hypothetical protein [Candidatus Aenigmarchaeota archaeon]